MSGLSLADALSLCEAVGKRRFARLSQLASNLHIRGMDSTKQRSDAELLLEVRTKPPCGTTR
jgi:hypothetical protein